MTFRLYFDDDSESKALTRALVARGYDVARATDVGMRGRLDREHLEFATAQARVLFTANRVDFVRLDAEWARTGRAHGGIIILAQQRYSIGEQLRRLDILMATHSAAEMQSRVTWFSTVQ